MHINSYSGQNAASSQSANTTPTTSNSNSNQKTTGLTYQRAKLEVTLDYQDGGKSLHLLYRSTIESISVETGLAVEDTQETGQSTSGVDVSPEATANRIVSLSTGLFSRFKAQHPGEDEQAVHQKFMDIIGKGIERGFAEARKILDGLGVLQGDIASNIDKTWDLVQTGLKQYNDQFLASLSAATSTSSTATPSTSSSTTTTQNTSKS